jgi:hypothetical protein
LEMVLHHASTCIAFSGGYFMNIASIGLMVSILMDFCNLWVHYAKAFSGTTYTKTCYVFGGGMWIFWMYTRLICFPIVFAHSLFYQDYLVPGVSGSSQQTVFNILGVICLIILVLSIWWAYLITIMLYKAIKTGE